MTNEEKLEEIKKIVLFNMKVSCGSRTCPPSCKCRNKEILDIIEKDSKLWEKL